MYVNFKILCDDSIRWLKNQPNRSVPNFITGIPDLNELNQLSNQEISIEQYKQFFNHVARSIFQKVKEDGYCIFIQTDRKMDGQLIDKSYLLTHIADQLGFKLLWHKIVCLRDIGKKNLFRPTYSHFMCYSINGTPGQAFEDVLPVSPKLYENATPYAAAKAATDFLSKQIKKQKKNPNDSPYDVVDPFIGQGTIGVTAIQNGLSFLGIDIDKKQCQLSQKLLQQTFDQIHQ